MVDYPIQTDIDNSQPFINNYKFETYVLNVTAAESWAKGTVLARITSAGATQGRIVRYDSSLTNGGEVPMAILSRDLVFDGAGTPEEDVIVQGSFYLEQLVKAEGGELTPEERDLLRSLGLLTYTTNEYAETYGS